MISPTTNAEASPADGCPEAERLEAWWQDRLDDQAGARLMTHLDDCPDCQATAERLLRAIPWPPVGEWCPAETAHPVGTVRDLPPPAEEVGSEPAASEPIAARLPVLLSPEQRRRYTFEALIGIGGGGAVFRAYDRRQHRAVAIKFPHLHAGDDQETRRRFRLEALATMRLNHPHIVQVFDSVLDSERDCFLVSELILGPSLADWRKVHPPGDTAEEHEQVARIVRGLAEGVRYAHEHKVLHRDLKPSNVLLAPHSWDGLPFTPKLTDFGLALMTETSLSVRTADFKVCGSLPYMAPEQILDARRVGPGCDIYALGVILYELLTGDLPIQTDTPLAMLTAIPRDPVPRLPFRRRRVPADLEAICLKCLEKSPHQRYASARLLSEDLSRFLAGQRVSARLPGPGELAARWIRRNPTVSAVGLTLFAAGCLVMVLLLDSIRRQSTHIGELETANRGRREANLKLETSNHQLQAALGEATAARQLAVTRQRQTQERLYVSEFQQANQAWFEKDWAATGRILDRLAGPEFAEFRGVECDWLRAKLERPHRELTCFQGAVHALDITPDGARLAAAGKDSLVRLIRYEDGQLLAEWPTSQGEVNGLLFTPDGESLWTSGDDGTLRQWATADGTERRRVVALAPGKAFDLRGVPGSHRFASSGSDGYLRIWDMTTGERLAENQVLRGTISGFDYRTVGKTWLAGGRSLEAGGNNPTIRMMDADLDRSLAESRVIMNPKVMLGLRDQPVAVIGGAERQITFWQPETEAQIEVVGFADAVIALLEHPSGGLVYAFDAAGQVYAIVPPKTEDYRPASTIRRTEASGLIAQLHRGAIYAGVNVPGHPSLLTASADGAVRDWTWDAIRPLQGRTAVVGKVNHVTGTTADGAPLHWNDRGEMCRVDLRTLNVQPLYQLPEQRFLHGMIPWDHGTTLSVEAEHLAGVRRLVRRSLPEGHLLHEQPVGGPANEPQRVLLLKDAGQVLIADTAQPCCHMFDARTLAPLPRWEFRAPPKQVAVSAAGDLVAVSQEDAVEVHRLPSRVRLWSRDTGAAIEDLVFVEPANRLLTAGRDRVIRQWDLATGQLLHEMVGHREAIGDLNVTADGRTLISSGRYGTEILFWHLPTGEYLGRTAPVLQAIHHLTLSADEAWILVYQMDGTLRTIPLRRSPNLGLPDTKAPVHIP